MNCTRLYSAARIADDLGPGADLIGLAAVTEVGISRRAGFERQRRLTSGASRIWTDGRDLPIALIGRGAF